MRRLLPEAWGLLEEAVAGEEDLRALPDAALAGDLPAAPFADPVPVPARAV